MRFFHILLLTTSVFLSGFFTHTHAATFNEGVDYQVLESPRPVPPGKKIEVIEFFWYGCPHCNAFDPKLGAWVKKQGNKIIFKRVPVSFRPSFVPQQQLYYTLEVMGKIDQLHSKIFHAIHEDSKKLDTDALITDFVAAQGINKQQFLDTYSSFGVAAKVRSATQQQSDYKIKGVPTVIINGKYVTSPSIAGAALGPNPPENASLDATIKVMDFLLTKRR